jgi:hypothetical protein
MGIFTQAIALEDRPPSEMDALSEVVAYVIHRWKSFSLNIQKGWFL